MKTCVGCKHAEWNKTTAGRLHPSGSGRCAFPWKMPALPACKYIVGGVPIICGGSINRREDLKDHCTYYAGEPAGIPQKGGT